VVADAAVVEWRVAEHMASLIAKSLVIAERTAQGARYRLLETTRVFAAEQLEANGETMALAERHARYFTGLFEQAYAAWEMTPDKEWERLYAPELDNVRAAMAWALCDRGRAPIAIALGGAAGPLWLEFGVLGEARRFLDQVVERIDEDIPVADAARLLMWAGGLWNNSDPARHLALVERSVALYRQIGDRLSLATTEGMLGNAYVRFGRNAEAKALFDHAYETLSASDHKKSLGAQVEYLGILAAFMNNNIDARKYFTRALELARESKRFVAETICLGNLAEIEFALGSLDRAVELMREAIYGFRRLGRRDFLAMALNNLTSYLIVKGDLADAGAIVGEAFSLARESGGLILRNSLEPLAMLGALEGRHWQAALLLGFTAAGLAGSGEIREPTAQQFHDRVVQALKANLPAADIQALMAEGAQWSEAQAADFAFDELVSPRDQRIE